MTQVALGQVTFETFAALAILQAELADVNAIQIYHLLKDIEEYAQPDDKLKYKENFV